jgi:probable phosphoglycerate mutase
MRKISVNFIRHGQTSFNVLGKIQGSSDIPLTNNGIKQANECKVDKSIKYDIAFTSSLGRAKETLNIICNKLDYIPIIKINDLVIERGYGKFEGLTEDEIYNKYPNEFNSWKENENTLVEGAEKIEDVVKRVKLFIRFLIENNYENVLVVTHSGVLFAIFKFINNIDLGKRVTDVSFPNCSSSILDIFYNDKEIKLKFKVGDHTYENSCSPTESIIATP